jgi:hypothetical protein
MPAKCDPRLSLLNPDKNEIVLGQNRLFARCGSVPGSIEDGFGLLAVLAGFLICASCTNSLRSRLIVPWFTPRRVAICFIVKPCLCSDCNEVTLGQFDLGLALKHHKHHCDALAGRHARVHDADLVA